MRVLLTGARGQVGTEVARSLEGRAEILAPDRARLDLADGGSIVRAVREARPDVIVNAAAYTAVDRAESDEASARAINATAPGILAEEAKRCGALLLHYSTDYVFDGTKRSPYAESDPVNPINAYGRTKLEGERAIAQSGCDHLILRTEWVYGPHGSNFLLTMLRLAATRPELRVVDDQHGAPTSSLQLGRLTRTLLEGPGQEISTPSLARLRKAQGVYHATASGSTTWCGFARAIFEERLRQPGPSFAAPRVTPIPSSEFPAPARRPANSVLCCDKLDAAFGARLEDWRAGLRDVLSVLPAG
jgi:dTDP-4-dehydrorhamnose reductase